MTWEAREQPSRWPRRASVAAVLAVAALAHFTQPQSLPTAAMAGFRSTRGSITITDDLGRSVNLPHPVQRAVVFTRYTAEFVRAIAGAHAVVGVDFDPGPTPSDWPSLTNDMVVGQGSTEPDYDKIIALKPDVVFVPRNGAWSEAIGKLLPSQIPVVVVTGWDTLKHEDNVRLLGRIFDRQERAEGLNGFYRQYRNLLTGRLSGVRRKRVYWESASGDYRTVLRGSGWHDMIELAGGENVFSDVDITTQPSSRGTVHTFEVTAAEIAARQPEVLVKAEWDRYGSQTRAFSTAALESLMERPGLAGLPAVHTGHVYHLSSYVAAACSKIIGAVQLAKLLHPERFADVEPMNAMKVWLEEFQGVPYRGGQPYYLLGQTGS